MSKHFYISVTCRKQIKERQTSLFYTMLDAAKEPQRLSKRKQLFDRFMKLLSYEYDTYINPPQLKLL